MPTETHPVLQDLLQQAGPLSWLTLRITLRAEASGHLPPYLGSTLRGAFGHAFKQTVCLVRNQDCPSCMLQKRCPYPYLFETLRPEQATWMRRYDTVPHPFVFLPPAQSPRHWQAGDLLCFDFRLFGSALDLLPYCVLAWESMARAGLGAQRLRFALEAVAVVQANQSLSTLYTPGQPLAQELATPQLLSTLRTPEFPGVCRVDLLTPLRLKHSGQLLQQSLPFESLLASLLRRLSMLLYFHHGQQLDGDFATLTTAAKTLPPLAGELKWQDLMRWSNRQEKKMNLGGLSGWFVLGPESEPFWPLLWLGQFLLAGKNTSFGLGAYAIL